VQMKQAIVNLMANALEAMPDGGTLTLATRVTRADAGRLVDQSISQLGSDERMAEAGAVPSRPVDESTSRPASEEWVEVSVGDTGGGIPETILDDVFNPFFTTKEAGTGLGLALVRRIARAHGGQVDADNRPGQGVTFRIRLPKATEARRGAAA